MPLLTATMAGPIPVEPDYVLASHLILMPTPATDDSLEVGIEGEAVFYDPRRTHQPRR